MSKPSWAADPIIGAWKLQVAESKMSQEETSPKEALDVYREVGKDRIEFTRTGVQRNGEPIYSKWAWPAQGGTAERLEPSPLPEGASYIELLADPGSWYVTIMQNGKQSSLMEKTISKDGKTMHLRLKTSDAQGNPLEELHVFKKQ
ncbi:MAG: hypothetical protein JW793_06420 [Acidobacteria bacterium]|nr:hypothetical protein [Acidobacteriota bacterium]